MNTDRLSPDRVLSCRRSGVLLPASALQGQPGGALRDAAFRFIDWLAAAGFTVWQLLPLVPVDTHGSPYWARSDRAGNPQLLDTQAPAPGNEDDFLRFRAESADWLADYVLFEALSRAQGGAPWWRWPVELRDRQPEALAAARLRFGSVLRQLEHEQWCFDGQWRALRAYASARSVKIFGDLPIYVAPDSVATWTDRAQFQLDDTGQVLAVAGVPPDYFAVDGQLWGNPLYDWEFQQRDGFSFWLQRLTLQADRFDLLRIDHFRALAAYWSVPAGAATAREGHWCAAEGRALLQVVADRLPQLELVAEDLGVITPDVTQLRQDFGLPGMRVVQFGFDGDPRNTHLPHQHDAASVIYSGTHDNDTTLGWYESLSPFCRDLVRRYYGRADADAVDALKRSVLASVGQLAILPAQDVLGVGSEARLNRPGTVAGNWSWRLPQQALTPELALRYRDLNHLYARGLGK
jgi:4-alpha-glucanotransferase